MADPECDSAGPNDPIPIDPLPHHPSNRPSTGRTAPTIETRRETSPEPSERCLRSVVVAIHSAVHLGSIPSARDGQRGQSTVEYALILLGAAAIALALVSWVTGSNLVGRLFDTVIERILGQV